MLRCLSQRYIATADIVEVSVALAEALVLEREGAELEKSRGSRGGENSGSNAPLSSTSPATTTSLPTPGAAPAGAAGVAAASDKKETIPAPALAEVQGPRWTDEIAAENRRRVALLSESLDASDVHDLQVLRRSLERQLNEATTTMTTTKTTPNKRSLGRMGSRRGDSRQGSVGSLERMPSTLPSLEEEGQWRADMLGKRLAVVAKAVEKKGGWRSAVFLDSGEVNVDVNVEPWPPAEGVLMLQTVKDALVVQVAEVRCE